MNRNIEQLLIERASGGDEEAFSEIYFRLKDSIYGFAYRMTNQPQIAEEITQEVFVFFIEEPEKYDADRGSLFSFLCGITRNKILNHLKKRGTKLETDAFETEHFDQIATSNGKSPVNNLLRKEVGERIEKSVAMLSPFQREVLLLREIEDLSYDEIAEITEATRGVVKGRLYRARQALAKKLTPYVKSEEVDTYEVH